MSWQTYKQRKLASLAQAENKGELDHQIKKLLKKINSNPNLVSLSSCSGRMVLLMVDESGKKGAAFFAKWHKPLDPEEFEMKLTLYTSRTPLWFRVEPFILHVAAKDIDSAKGFLDNIRNAGIKRGGIQAISKDRINMEFQGTGYLAMPADPIREWNDLIKIANKLMKKNLWTIKKLEKMDW
jgi:tRNA wybutosine-synthesizing protein 3